MIKCHKCGYHHKTGYIHSCDKCANKKVFGTLTEPFLKPCSYYKANKIAELEAINEQRRLLCEKIHQFESKKTKQLSITEPLNDELYTLDQKARRLKREAAGRTAARKA